MKINYTPKDYHTKVLLQQNNVTMSIDELEVKSTTPAYDISIEIPFSEEWERFLRETHREHHIDVSVSQDIYGNKKIFVETFNGVSGLIWLGYWFQNWKANQN
jgi:hypothetical protein